MHHTFRGAALACVLAAGSTLSAQGEDFRIQSRVTIGPGQVARENITLFHQNLVYDFMTQPAAVTVFDPGSARFVLLDPIQRRKSEVTLETLDRFLADLRREAAGSNNGLLKFLARPEFRESEAADGQLVLASPWMTYEMRTVAAHSREASRKYREFSDAFARLNTLTNPASLPPFARLAVNALLDRRSALPSEVRLTIVTQTTPERKEITYESRHQVQWRLLDEDLTRISQVESDRESFAATTLEQFFSPSEQRQAQRPTATRVR